MCNHSFVKWCEVVKIFARVDYVREMTAERSCKYGQQGSFKELLFFVLCLLLLLLLVFVVFFLLYELVSLYVDLFVIYRIIHTSIVGLTYHNSHKLISTPSLFLSRWRWDLLHVFRGQDMISALTRKPFVDRAGVLSHVLNAKSERPVCESLPFLFLTGSGWNTCAVMVLVQRWRWLLKAVKAEFILTNLLARDG